MNWIQNRSVMVLATFGLVCVSLLAAENSIVIRPDDFASIDVRAEIVEVTIKGPKAKQLADKERYTTIQFNVPFEQAREVLIGETRFAPGSAIIGFKFPTESSAASFAKLLKAAKVKILSQCDCH